MRNNQALNLSPKNGSKAVNSNFSFPHENTDFRNSRKNHGQPPLPSFNIPHNVVFPLFFISHLLAALYSPIHDCDEVYNYWEPTHYLNHGHGLQTWEYSPEYGIRSWAYLLPHAILINAFKFFLPAAAKQTEFFLLRATLGAVCAACETKLFGVLARVLGPRIAALFAVVSATSTGFFHASVAYLPSSFAMYAAMLGTAASMDRGGRLRYSENVFWFSVGGFFGWPFSLAIAAPYVLDQFGDCLSAENQYSVNSWVSDSVYKILVVLVRKSCFCSFAII